MGCGYSMGESQILVEKQKKKKNIRTENESTRACLAFCMDMYNKGALFLSALLLSPSPHHTVIIGLHVLYHFTGHLHAHTMFVYMFLLNLFLFLLMSIIKACQKIIVMVGTIPCLCLSMPVSLPQLLGASQKVSSESN